MKLETLIPPDVLAEAIAFKHVRTQRHPTLPLSIFNYSELAVFAGAWNAATMNCRGLIVDDDNNIIARPFKKFFNAAEHENPARGGLPTHEPVPVTDKADGSLGILYAWDGVLEIATRGSFASDQAQHATDLYRRKYAGWWEPVAGHTYLFEVIFPSNRIVLDYGQTDDLILLGAVDIETGVTLTPDEARAESGWFGPVTETFPYASYREALEAPPRPNAEGVVVHFRESDLRVKLKYAEYVKLHKIITGTSTITVWENLAAGTDMATLLDNVPDEFYEWVKETIADLTAQHRTYIDAAHTVFEDITERVGLDDRKSFALHARQHLDVCPALFSLLDGKSIDAWAWKQVKPAWSLPFAQSETNA